MNESNDELNENQKLMRDMYEIISLLSAIIPLSTGIAEYHLDGDTARWSEFDEFYDCDSIIERYKAIYG